MKHKNYADLPNFICVGAQKAGTTSLHNILKMHPDIYLPEIKETKFFQRNHLYDKGLDFYQKTYFADVRAERAVGEIDPEYLYFDCVPGRIYESLGGDIKLIFILRNPVHRAYSHYLMSFKRAYESEGFEKAVELESQRLPKDEFSKNHFSYITRGLYCEQIQRYLELFEREKMFFIIFEEFFDGKFPVIMEQLLDFLDVRRLKLERLSKSNPAGAPKSLIVRDFLQKRSGFKELGKFFFPFPTVRKRIKEILNSHNLASAEGSGLSTDLKENLYNRYFREDVKQLEVLLNRDLSLWSKQLMSPCNDIAIG